MLLTLPRKRIRKDSYAISPIELKSKCFRRWAFGAIGRLPRVDTGSKTFGNDAHGMAEEYLISGAIPDLTTREGKTFAKGVHLLPRPGSVAVEDEFVIEIDGIKLDGKVDFRGFYWSWVGDHKFVSDTNKTEWYAIEPDALRQNWQANLYALASAIKSRRNGASLYWVWYPKRTGSATPTRVYIPLSDSLAFVRANMLPHVRDMVRAKEYFKKVDRTIRLSVINAVIPCNEAHCLDYRAKCDYHDYCER